MLEISLRDRVRNDKIRRTDHRSDGGTISGILQEITGFRLLETEGLEKTWKTPTSKSGSSAEEEEEHKLRNIKQKVYTLIMIIKKITQQH